MVSFWRESSYLKNCKLFDLYNRADRYFCCHQKCNQFTGSSNIQAISPCICCIFDNSSNKGDHWFSIVPYAYIVAGNIRVVVVVVCVLNKSKLVLVLVR